MPDESEWSSADLVVIGEWLARLEVARRLCRLYDPDHRATMRARQQLRVATDRIAHRQFVVLVSPDGFRLPERSLGALAKASAELAAQLWRLGIKAVRVRPPVAADAAERLLRLLSDLHDRPTEEDRARFLQEEEGIEGVDLLPIVLDGMVYAEDVEPDHSPRLGGPASAGGAGRPVPGKGGGGEAPGARIMEGGRGREGDGGADAIDGLLALLDRPPGAADDGSELLLAMERVFPGAGPGPGERRRTGADASSMLDGIDDLFDVDGGVGGPPGRAAGPARAAGVEGHARRLRAPQPTLSGRRPPPAREESWARPPAPHSGFGQRRSEAAGSARVPAYHQHPLLRRALGSRSSEWPARDLGEHAVRRHIDVILMAAHRVWPESELAGRAREGLVRRYFERLELGEFELASAIVRDLVTADAPELTDRMCDEHGLGALLEALATWGKEHRREVARIAALLGERLVPPISHALASEERMSHRRRMLEMLLAIGTPAIPMVRGWLSDERWFVVRNGLLVLRHLHAPGLAAAAAPLADHAEPRVAAEAIRCLRAAEDPTWQERFRDLLGRHDGAARREAMTLASTLREPDLGHLLLAELDRRRGLQLGDEETLDLIAALGHFPLPEVAEQLQRLAALSNWRYPFRLTPVWEAAARAAVHQPSPAAEEILARIARRRDPAAELARDLLARRREGGP